MDDFNRKELFKDAGYKTRYLNFLINQIEKDYSDFSRLWEKQQEKPLTDGQEKELVRVSSWLNKEVKLFRKLQKLEITGIISGKISEIENKLIIHERAE